MVRYFVPFTGNRPAPLVVNGHKLLLVSQDRDDLQDQLESIGGDNVRTVPGSGVREMDQAVLEKLAGRVKGGVVLVPNDVAIEDLIRSLEHQVPWLQ